MNNQWISVEDQLPAWNQWVIVNAGSAVWIGRPVDLGNQDFIWQMSSGFENVTVDYWMPLPEPPEVQS